ncbi:uncharacterized protein LOC107405909 isoform X2 [Ziziphus jujuba]|uniref:Uncharacterized protein LOC107405909 isoform X2 n=1 Tax=Ziziphus jujuba TaxID=326968 RepID=A0A6P6FSW4_ZIZJJ|nr:uncharacterized protein LOC107405909 isoform X2 [Ziziphus jujuba]
MAKWAWWSGKRVYWVIMVLHLVAILIFTRGFLLTRTELPFHSHCSDVSHSPCFFNSSSHRHHCWTEPAVGRLLIIVLDALRFDFVAPSNIFQEPKPWMDKLQVLQKLASQRPSSARIFKAIADPPTTSLQRLKGLTTGGLPTFIDVGNSFGAPAIVEDNFIRQLVQNGKRVSMMGDDTWMQLFPNHFNISYAYPSFNVKDLHTVDNGCIKHLLPSLYQEDWDVLIAHFLGVDHAGHIFGVDSNQMLEKLEQYNVILQKVIEVLESQSGPGGLHENTFLLVMGDHGQTLNGDHGGGTAEEVETAIFAMSFKKPSSPQQSNFGTSFGESDSVGRDISISSIQQLDFAVTISALIGIPFPFGSIGHVDPKLYALGAGMENFEDNVENCQNQSKLQEWMQNYANVLCINSWQVKRYLDVYSASSVIGFSSEDLLHIADLYAQAVEKWSGTTKNLLISNNESCNTVLPALKRQIDVYSNFLANVAELARSKWTEFNLMMMGVGLGIMLVSLSVHILAIKRTQKQYDICFTSSGDAGTSFGLLFACFIVVIRACSFLSNSYILEEGKVASFLLATTVVTKLQYLSMKKKMLLEAIAFLLLITICRYTIEVGLTKQAPGSEFLNLHTSWMPRIAPVWMFVTELVPMLGLIFLAFLLYKVIYSDYSAGIEKYVMIGTNLSYVLIAFHWALESSILNLSWVLEGVGRNSIPRIIFAIGFGQLSVLMFGRVVAKEKSLDCKKNLITKTVAMLSACSSTIIILLGKQGPLASIAAIIGGYCITRLGNIKQDANNESSGNLTMDPLPVTQWSLLAVCLFFCTGHWCAFDGLRYGAAFIGFDEFILVRQAVLLTIDTFGFSLILPVFGLPFLVACQQIKVQTRKQVVFAQLSLAYMIYGLIMATTVTATIICVTIQRRHLMVWGLFAPKFVFDVVGLILMDILICLASLYYLVSFDNDSL